MALGALSETSGATKNSLDVSWNPLRMLKIIAYYNYYDYDYYYTAIAIVDHLERRQDISIDPPENTSY